MIEIRATVTRVFYSTPRFTAGKMKINRETPAEPTHCRPAGSEEEETFKVFGPLSDDDAVVLRGEWVDDPKYGHQFHAKSYEHDRPDSADEVVRFFTRFRHIGPVRARRLVEGLGNEVTRVLCADPPRFAEVAGIPTAQAEEIRGFWFHGLEKNEVRLKLAGYGFTPAQQEKLLETYGSTGGLAAIERVLRENPYDLIEAVTGFGWKTVDAIALRFGRERVDPARARAGVAVTLDRRLADGHCWTHRAETVSETVKLLQMRAPDEHDRVQAAVGELLAPRKLLAHRDDGREALSLREIYEQEKRVAEVVACRAEWRSAWFAAEEVDELLASFPELNGGQRAAVRAALEQNILVVVGKAGTGKTHIIRAIARAFFDKGAPVALVAPTGKAARRIEEATGRPAMTIHRFLGGEYEEQKRKYEDFERTDGEREALRVTPERAGLVVVDEASMADVPLVHRLLARLGRRATVLLVGDENQLPSVGPGAVLRDLVQREPCKVVVLDEVVRQAGRLKENAVAVLSGVVRETEAAEPFGKTSWWVCEAPEDPEQTREMLLALWTRVLPEDFGLDPLRDVQVIAPTKKGPLGTIWLNACLQEVTQRSFGVEARPPVLGEQEDAVEEDEDDEGRAERGMRFYARDRVIHIKNDYYLGVMNGEQGHVVAVDPSSRNLVVQYDFGNVTYTPDRQQAELRHAYAITAHKFQGSEIPCAVVVVTRSRLCTKNWLYTAVTRATRTTILVGARDVIDEAARREETVRRRTHLSYLLGGRG